MHAALGEPSRLAIVDQLAASDRSPQELQEARRCAVEPVGPPPRRARGGRPDRAQPVQWGRAPPLRPPAPRSASSASDHGTAVSPGRCCSCAPRTRPAHSSPPVCGPRPPARRRSVPAPTRPSGSIPARSPPPAAPASTSATRSRPSLDEIRRRPPLTITVCDRAHEELDPAARLAALVDPRPRRRSARRRRSTPPSPSSANASPPLRVRHDRAR